MGKMSEPDKKTSERVVIIIENNGDVSIPLIKSLIDLAYSLNPEISLEDWYRNLKNVSQWCG